MISAARLPAEALMRPLRARGATDPVLAQFCREQHPRLFGALKLYTRDHHLAEELTQETLVRVVSSWRKVSELDSPEAWTFRVAMNLANSSYRRAGARRRALTRLGARRADGSVDDPVDAVALREALATLPPRQRAALVLRFYADLPTRDAAAAMGCAEGTVSALVHQAVAQLRLRPGFEKMETPRV